MPMELSRPRSMRGLGRWILSRKKEKSVDFTIELTSVDSDSGIIGAVGGTFALLAA